MNDMKDVFQLKKNILFCKIKGSLDGVDKRKIKFLKTKVRDARNGCCQSSCVQSCEVNQNCEISEGEKI